MNYETEKIKIESLKRIIGDLHSECESIKEKIKNYGYAWDRVGELRDKLEALNRRLTDAESKSNSQTISMIQNNLPSLREELNFVGKAVNLIVELHKFEEISEEEKEKEKLKDLIEMVKSANNEDDLATPRWLFDLHKKIFEAIRNLKNCVVDEEFHEYVSEEIDGIWKDWKAVKRIPDGVEFRESFKNRIELLNKKSEVWDEIRDCEGLKTEKLPENKGMAEIIQKLKDHLKDASQIEKLNEISERVSKIREAIEHLYSEQQEVMNVIEKMKNEAEFDKEFHDHIAKVVANLLNEWNSVTSDEKFNKFKEKLKEEGDKTSKRAEMLHKLKNVEKLARSNVDRELFGEMKTEIIERERGLEESLDNLIKLLEYKKEMRVKINRMEKIIVSFSDAIDELRDFLVFENEDIISSIINEKEKHHDLMNSISEIVNNATELGDMNGVEERINNLERSLNKGLRDMSVKKEVLANLKEIYTHLENKTAISKELMSMQEKILKEGVSEEIKEKIEKLKDFDRLCKIVSRVKNIRGYRNEVEDKEFYSEVGPHLPPEFRGDEYVKKLLSIAAENYGIRLIKPEPDEKFPQLWESIIRQELERKPILHISEVKPSISEPLRAFRIYVERHNHVILFKEYIIDVRRLRNMGRNEIERYIRNYSDEHLVHVIRRLRESGVMNECQIY